MGMFLGSHGDADLAGLQAWQSLSGTASRQAYVLAFADSFVSISVVLAVSAVLVLMLPPLREREQRSGSSASAPPKSDTLVSGRSA